MMRFLNRLSERFRSGGRSSRRGKSSTTVESMEQRTLLTNALPVLMVIADDHDFYYQEYGDTRASLEAAGVEVDVAATTLSPSTPHANSGQGTAPGAKENVARGRRKIRGGRVTPGLETDRRGQCSMLSAIRMSSIEGAFIVSMRWMPPSFHAIRLQAVRSSQRPASRRVFLPRRSRGTVSLIEWKRIAISGSKRGLAAWAMTSIVSPSLARNNWA